MCRSSRTPRRPLGWQVERAVCNAGMDTHSGGSLRAADGGVMRVPDGIVGPDREDQNDSRDPSRKRDARE